MEMWHERRSPGEESSLYTGRGSVPSVTRISFWHYNLTLSWLPPLGRLTGLSDGVLTAEFPALLGPATADIELELASIAGAIGAVVVTAAAVLPRMFPIRSRFSSHCTWALVLNNAALV